ncbi:putative TIR-NBS-LRR resistance protein [Trifolium pratense]|uniref:Putative TIR-NBS-LRR resistance protein n=3 Tax=Trifolium pratense TaxID=57577 RepID=A0A2K3LT25_TRIPR|nr:putative TIR-NBS-LRR resistance protein [Trifolium pratense]
MKGRNLKSMMLFVTYYSSPDNIILEGCQGVLIINYTKATVQVYKIDTLTSFEDEDWQSITSNLEPSNKVEVMVVFGEGFTVVQTTVSLLYDVPIDKEMEHCNAVYREDVIVSSDDDNNVNDYINAPVDNNVIRPGEDENVGEDKHSHAVDKNSFVSRDDVMAPNMDYAVPGGGDMPADKVVSISNENVSDSKNGDANASCKANKNVSSGDKNRICRLFIKLPSLVRAALISRPFWFGLVSILVWITCCDSKKRSSRNLCTR